MNYCNEKDFKYNGIDYAEKYNLSWNNNGVLSPNDLVNFQSIYGSNKMKFQVATASGPLGTGQVASLFQRGGPTSGNMPDLYTVTYGRATGTMKVEVHALSAASNYQQWIAHSATPLNINGVDFNYSGFSFVDVDKDGVPDLCFFVRNQSAGRMNFFALSGASNWQTYIRNVATPLPSRIDYKYAYGDVDGDGYPDLYAINPNGSGQAILNVLPGSSSYTTTNRTTAIALKSYDVANCRFLVGNMGLWNATPRNRNQDILCMKMIPTSSETPIGMKVMSSSSDYQELIDYGNTQLLYENGGYSDFGLWSGDTSESMYLRGTGIYIGYIKKQGAPTTEIHFIRASRYF